MRSFRSYGFSISGEHFLRDYISWSRRVCTYTRAETYNGRKLVRLATEPLNFLILKLEEKYNKFDVQPWTKENDTSRNLNLVRVYRNIHLIVMDHLSKGDLLFPRMRRKILHYLSHQFHSISSFLDLEFKLHE